MQGSGPILTTILAALLSGVLGGFVAAQRAKAELRKEIEKEFNEKKWEIYLDFVETVKNVLTGAPLEQNSAQTQVLSNRLLDFATKLWLIGSDEVVERFNVWIGSARAGDLRMFKQLAEIIIAMRKDLGLSTTKVEMAGWKWQISSGQS